MQWQWEAVPGVAAFAVAWLVGGFVFLARPDRAQNRWLSAFIVLEGVYLASISCGRFLAETRAEFQGVMGISGLAGALALVPYMMFLATLETPIVRPLRTTVARALLSAFGLFAVVAWFSWPESFFSDVRQVEGAWTETNGLLDQLLTGLAPLVAFLFGFVVAVDAWRRAAPGTASRQRARAYAVAFGFRDAAFVSTIIVFSWVLRPDEWQLDRWAGIFVPIVQLVYLPLVVYGIAKTQLFDIDLKIKWTLRRGTVAAVFVAVFIVATVTAENFLTDRYGWAVGSVAAGLLLFALAPLQKGADRLADRAMPRVNPGSEYEAFRKLSVYRAAVESAHEEGGVSAKERRILDRMRQKLGVEIGDARRIESEFARPSPARHGSTRAA